MTKLTKTTNQAQKSNGIRLTILKNGELRTRTWFGVVEKSVVDVLLSTFLIYCSIQGILSSECNGSDSTCDHSC